MVAVLGPFVGRIRRSRSLSAALDGITVEGLGLMAAVTAQLARRATSDIPTTTIAIATLVVLLRWRPDAAWLVAAGAVIGVAHALAPLTQRRRRQ